MAEQVKKPRKRRKSKWDASIPAKLIEYFDTEPFEKNEEGKIVGKPLPSIRRFAKNIGVVHGTIYDWLDPESPRYKKTFDKAFKVARELRKDVIITGGLLGYYHHSFAKFVAVNMTDMVSDKKEVDQTHSTKDDKPLKFVVYTDPDE